MRKLTAWFPFLLLVGSIAWADTPTTHGMLLFGRDAVYASHLPMFHKPHDYQVLLKLTLNEKAKKAFMDFQEANPKQRIYTLVPEKFDLSKKMKKGETFTATIVPGHFEKDEVEPLVKDTKVEIEEVIVFEKFKADAKRPEKAEYYLFGTATDPYLAHVITKRPNFDHVIAAKLDDVKTFKGLRKVVFGDNNDETPIKEKASSDGVTATRELYLEINELE